MPALEVAPRLAIYYLDPHPVGCPPVLLLHGLGATGESWGLQIPALVNFGYRPLAPDARGFGKSTYPGGSHSIANMAADMGELLTKLEVIPAHVVGISMGGTLALQLALDHPELIKKLVLVNTFASLRPDRLSVWLYFLMRFVMVHTVGIPNQAQAVAKRIFPTPEQEGLRNILIAQILQANPSGYRASMRALGVFNVTKRLGEITLPTLVITGENDSTVPAKNQYVLATRIPAARQVFIPKAGHAVIAEQPEAFNKVLLEFLRS